MCQVIEMVERRGENKQRRRDEEGSDSRVNELAGRGREPEFRERFIKIAVVFGL